MSTLKKWMLYISVSLLAGIAIGYALLWAWFFFTLFILGYGDSGPSWINTVSDVVFWSGVGLSIIVGQIIFFKNLPRP
jgi:hypothetical protein